MKALSGAPADLAARALAAGCDVALYCPGDFEGTRDVLAACPVITPDTQARMATARAMVRHRIVTLDGVALAAERDRLLA